MLLVVFCYFCAWTWWRYHRLGRIRYGVVEPLGLLLSRRKSVTKSRTINTAAMNQKLESDIDDANQTLKYTKAEMRKILAQIAANQNNHGQPQDAKVSIV